jgi:hypothetical protein
LSYIHTLDNIIDNIIDAFIDAFIGNSSPALPILASSSTPLDFIDKPPPSQEEHLVFRP